MKKEIRTIGAIALAAAMMMGMQTTAFAQESDDSAAVGTTAVITDVFTISDGDSAANLPAATFEYSIAAGTGAAATATTPKISDGIGTPTVNNAVHAATASGVTEDRQDVEFDFSGVSFTEAGIYRYTVSQTKGESNVSEDIEADVDNNGAGSYFLDVYVQKDGGNFTPFAYVLSKDGAIENEAGEDGTTANYASKVDTITNEYTTYDLTVSKTIIGDMAANSFAFQIEVDGVPADVIIRQDGEDNAESENYTLTADLGNEQSTVITGLPSTVSYQIQEAVNQLEGYQVEVSDSNESAAEYNWIGDEGSAEAYGNSASVIGKQDVTVGFTNTLNNISPTGLVMRYAPYILILAAGIVIAIIATRKKSRDDD